MQRDGVPHQLDPAPVPVRCFAPQEVARRVGAVDFEAQVRRHELAGRVPAEIVQDGGDGCGFRGRGRRGRAFGGLSWCRRARSVGRGVGHGVEVRFGVGEGLGDEGGVGDCHSGEDSGG